MTNIEFKVQFVSESHGGKGSCKGTIFKDQGGGGAVRDREIGMAALGKGYPRAGPAPSSNVFRP